MDNFTIINVAAARLGAACSVARSPWTNVTAAGATYALGWKLSIAAAGNPDVRRTAVRHAQPMSAQMTQFAALERHELLPPIVVKPNNVNTTRIAAGGYGAMGPHPERERLA